MIESTLSLRLIFYLLIVDLSSCLLFTGSLPITVVGREGRRLEELIALSHLPLSTIIYSMADKQEQGSDSQSEQIRLNNQHKNDLQLDQVSTERADREITRLIQAYLFLPSIDFLSLSLNIHDYHSLY